MTIACGGAARQLLMASSPVAHAWVTRTEPVRSSPACSAGRRRSLSSTSMTFSITPPAEGYQRGFREASTRVWHPVGPSAASYVLVGADSGLRAVVEAEKFRQAKAANDPR